MANNNQIYKMSNAGGFKSLNRYHDMLAGNPVFVASSYESIETFTVGAGGSSSINFNSIPGTYKHLQLRIISRDGQAGTGFNNNIMRINGDTGSNYSSHYLYGDGSSVGTAGNGSASSFNVAIYVAANGNTSGVFGVAVMDILDYANTSKFKTMRSLTGGDANGSGIVIMTSSVWQNTSAITSLAFTGTTYQQHSQFALYGIRG
jgi:hypothetical protein